MPCPTIIICNPACLGSDLQETRVRQKFEEYMPRISTVGLVQRGYGERSLCCFENLPRVSRLYNYLSWPVKSVENNVNKSSLESDSISFYATLTDCTLNLMCCTCTVQ